MVLPTRLTVWPVTWYCPQDWLCDLLHGMTHKTDCVEKSNVSVSSRSWRLTVSVSSQSCDLTSCGHPCWVKTNTETDRWGSDLFSTDDSKTCLDVWKCVRSRNNSLAFVLLTELSMCSTIQSKWRLVHKPLWSHIARLSEMTRVQQTDSVINYIYSELMYFTYVPYHNKPQQSMKFSNILSEWVVNSFLMAHQHIIRLYRL